MTGAGSTTIAWTPETSYNGGPESTPTYYGFGADVTDENVQIQNNLSLLSDPDAVMANEALAENFRGSLAVSATLKHNNHHNIVFNDDSDGSGTNDRWVAAQWPSVIVYVGLDHRSGITEQAAAGAIPESYEVRYQQGQEVTYTLRFAFGDVDENTSITPGPIENPGQPVPSHGTELQIDAGVQADLQSATLSCQPLAMFINGPGRHPTDAVNQRPEPELQMNAVFDDRSNLKRAYGSGNATSPEDSVNGYPATLSFDDAAGNSVAQYNISGLTAGQWSWENLVSGDTPAAESLTAQMDDLEVEA